MRIALSISLDHKLLAKVEKAMDSLRLNRSDFFAKAADQLADKTLTPTGRPRTSAKKGTPR